MAIGIQLSQALRIEGKVLGSFTVVYDLASGWCIGIGVLASLCNSTGPTDW